MNSKFKTGIYFIIIYACFCLLSLNRHARTIPFNYHSEIFADKAGYNVYLPALFIYNNHHPFPDSLSAKTGYGFKIDSISQHIITKYPYGVALLQSPFWLLAHLVSDDQNGYSFFYQKSINFSACFYFTLGLFLLFYTLKVYHTTGKSILLLFIFALSSGIFYYGIFDTGMSHVYSFCCISAIVWLFFNINTFNEFAKFLMLAAVLSIFIMIRPVNIIFLIPVLYYFLLVSTNINLNLLIKIKFYQWVLLGMICCIIVFPQLYYYKYAFGGFFSNSYHKESFYIPTIDRIIELLFSSNNGLIIYYPVILILTAFTLFYKNKFSRLLLITIFCYIILYASWWSLSLGCSFGHRAFNDIILIFFLPVLFLTKQFSKIWYWLFIIACAINIKFMFSYDGCLYTSNIWNYSEYFSILFGEFK